MPTIGIIGSGWGARIQVPAFRAAGWDVAGLAGSDAAKTAQIGAELGIPVTTGDWRELVAHPEIDLISIVTPPVLHAEMALAVLVAGKHVLCEKPTAMNAAEAQAMAEAAAARPDQIALIDHELRFHPTMRELRRLLAEGAIGALERVEIALIANSRRDPSRQWNWWSDASQGGGALGAIGSHQIDSARYLLQSEVAAAQGRLMIQVGSRPDSSGAMRQVTADDSCGYEVRMANGALVSAEVTLVAEENRPNRFTLFGSAGRAEFSGGRLLVSDQQGERDVTPPHSVAIPAAISGEFPEATVYLAHALHAALNGDRSALAPAATFADGLAIQRTLDAIRASHGAWITL